MLPAAWMQVLETIEQSLLEAVRRAAEHGPPEPAAPPAAGRDAAWQEALARLEGRIAGLRDGVERAAQSATEADAALADAAEGLSGWLRAARQGQQKLEGGGGRAV